MDIEKAISIENLNRYKKNTNDKIKSYVDTKTSVIQDGTKTVGGVSADDYNAFKSAVEDSHTHSNKSVLDEIDESVVKGGNSLSGSTGYTVNDSVEYPIVGLKLFGNSEQKQYSGKNLFDRNKIYKSDSFQGEDGSYGTNLNFSVYSIIVKNNTKYVLSIDATNFFDNANVRIHSVDENDNWISQLRSFPIPERGKYSFEFTTTSTKIHISILHSHYDVQLELGSTATDYEPYVGGIPSPNLDYPQEIVSVVEPTVTVNNDTNNVSLPLQYTLNAIPVSTGGNVTIDGKKYIADYMDFGEGKYHRLVDPDKLDPTVSIVDNLDLLLETEEVTDIPEADMQAYRQLHTYNGVTNISNDKGAGLSVEYCTSKMLAEYALPLIKDLEAENAKKDEEISILKTDILNNENKITELQNENSLNEKVKFLNNMQRTGKVYTVRFPLWETSQTCNGEKLDDNAGLVCNPSTAVTRGVSDYDDIPLFRTYDCNAYVDDNGVRHITALKGDSNFKDVGKVDVFVLGMSYYEKWWQADGYVYYSRTDMPKEGYTLAAECRTKDGADQGFALYGKYIAGDIDGKPYSSKGLVPARNCSGRPAGSQNISYSGNISYFHQRGNHYSGTFMSEIKYIATSWWLKYGTRNSQSVMAGCTNYIVQYVSTVAETDVKRIIISNANANDFDVGMPVSIGDSGSSAPDRNNWDCHSKAESTKITAIESYDENNKAIYVDTDTPFTTTLTTYISSFHWRSGFSDLILGRDGCPCLASSGLTNGKYPVVFQGIECFVGIYETVSNAIADIVDSSGTRDIYITNNSSILTSTVSAIKDKYQKLDNQISVTKLKNWNYITAISVDTKTGTVIPTDSGQSGNSSSTGYADAVYVNSEAAGQKGLLAFGTLGLRSLCGVSCVNCGNGLSASHWSVGARLSING